MFSLKVFGKKCFLRGWKQEREIKDSFLVLRLLVEKVKSRIYNAVWTFQKQTTQEKLNGSCWLVWNLKKIKEVFLSFSCEQNTVTMKIDRDRQGETFFQWKDVRIVRISECFLLLLFLLLCLFAQQTLSSSFSWFNNVFMWTIVNVKWPRRTFEFDYHFLVWFSSLFFASLFIFLFSFVPFPLSHSSSAYFCLSLPV